MSVKAPPWSRAFDDPITLPDGRALRTLALGADKTALPRPRRKPARKNWIGAPDQPQTLSGVHRQLICNEDVDCVHNVEFPLGARRGPSCPDPREHDRARRAHHRPVRIHCPIERGETSIGGNRSRSGRPPISCECCWSKSNRSGSEALTSEPVKLPDARRGASRRISRPPNWRDYEKFFPPFQPSGPWQQAPWVNLRAERRVDRYAPSAPRLAFTGNHYVTFRTRRLPRFSACYPPTARAIGCAMAHARSESIEAPSETARFGSSFP